MLHTELGKKFDGEPEVLYKHINKKILSDNSTLENEILSNNENKNNIKNIINELSNVMNINLFMPGYDNWDGEKIPLVTYFPYSKNKHDHDIKEVKAFDSQGNTVYITKENAKNYTYIVIGANERTDRDGNLIPMALPVEGGGGGGTGGGYIPKDYYSVILHKWQINYDWDPGWLLGSMELYIKLKIKDINSGQIIAQNDHWMIDGSYGVWDPKIYDIPLYTRVNNNAFSVYIEIWEDDGYFSGADDKVADGIWEWVDTWNGSYWQYLGVNIQYLTWNYGGLQRLREIYTVETPSSTTTITDYLWLDFRKETY